MTNSIAEIDDCPFLFVVGSNTTETHPVIAVAMKAAVRKGARLVVADPRRTGIAELADLHLRLRPGSDAWLFNAMAHVIVEEGLLDREYLAARADGLEELTRHLQRFAPERAEAITGIGAGIIRAVARDYARAERAGIYYTLGVTEHVGGVVNVQALCNLALLTGNLGRRSAGVNPLRGQNNVQGAGDAGALPNSLPGAQPVEDAAARGRFEAAWGVTLPKERGMTKTRALDAMIAGRIKAAWIVGENTLLSEADLHHTERAIRSLDFLAVSDLFPTETTRFAHVVFPAAAFAEQDGTFTNTERRVQLIRRAVLPPGEARPDWWILGEVGARLGTPAQMRYSSAAEVFAELCSLAPSYGGLSHARLERGGIQWPCPTPEHPGTEFLHAEGFGACPGGRARLIAAEPVLPDEPPDAEYPYLLTTGRRLAVYHTNTQTGRSAGFDRLAPGEELEVHPHDARVLGVAAGERVRVRSRRGEVVVPVAITDASPIGVVFLSFGFGATPTNVLTTHAADPVTDTPELKACAVAVERIST